MDEFQPVGAYTLTVAALASAFFPDVFRLSMLSTDTIFHIIFSQSYFGSSASQA